MRKADLLVEFQKHITQRHDAGVGAEPVISRPFVADYGKYIGTIAFHSIDADPSDFQDALESLNGKRSHGGQETPKQAEENPHPSERDPED